ncbi:hypothetical protein FF098_004435 [Parvularcula flava]|uniref:Uncharacterized protein n=1 Tax=Aquisalinus luteolus TaxID=1566827 RepID=A0A8J3A0W6_9PROT|nr:hypothetical protein [Aquisalinus luteolus]NHK27148.1 hypothetical protein [Aquisalinus luteolus]GGH94545.1 hypothetical protein GCM10011355_08980 [Aquisalinus luteolus]
MRFTEHFTDSVCDGDSIACRVACYDITAHIVRDDCSDEPDQRQDGFWPSLCKDAPGFIGPGPNHRQRFAEALERAEAIMEAWRRDEWFYCGIVLSVSLEGVTLDTHAASLWGIEANYPGSDNVYLTAVATELLPDAVNAGRAAARRVCAALKSTGARIP